METPYEQDREWKRGIWPKPATQERAHFVMQAVEQQTTQAEMQREAELLKAEGQMMVEMAYGDHGHVGA
jgi:hypothetical protein